MTPDIFIKLLTPAAVASAKKTGIPASYVIAAGALESGWGTSLLSTKGRNLFGVKADPVWKGSVLLLPTREFRKGKWVTEQAKWRFYPDWLACIADHAAFFKVNKRYTNALKCTSGEAFAYAVASAGYATDPDYASKLVSIIRKYELAKLDTPS